MSVETGCERVTPTLNKGVIISKRAKDDEKSNTAHLTSTIAASANEAQSLQGD